MCVNGSKQFHKNYYINLIRHVHHVDCHILFQYSIKNLINYKMKIFITLFDIYRNNNIAIIYNNICYMYSKMNSFFNVL